MSELTPEAVQALRAPFAPDELEKLPKTLSKDDRDRGTCTQGSKYSADGTFCGKYHARAVHLDYVGHAGITMRLLDVDPLWNWEPVQTTPAGGPMFTDGGLWIRLTVLGVTRLGYGDAAGKSGPNAIKETIGDAIRNAAMRFGVATYLWSKSAKAEQLAEFTPPDEAQILSEARSRAFEAAAAHRQDLDRDGLITFQIAELESAYDVHPAAATVDQWQALTSEWAGRPVVPAPPRAAEPAPEPSEPSTRTEGTLSSPALSTAGQWRMIGIRFSAIDSGMQDEERHYLSSAIVGRDEEHQITSSKELTQREAKKLIDWLSKIKTRDELEHALAELLEAQEARK